MTAVPQVPPGVRPIVGDHLSRVEISAAQRQWRRAVNLATVSGLRARPRKIELPAVAPYPKIFVVGCPRSGTSWVRSVIDMHPKVVSSRESHAYENIYGPVVAGGRHSIGTWTKILHRHDIGERELRWVGLHWWVNRAQLKDLAAWALHAEGTTDSDAAQRVIRGVFDSLFVARGGDNGTVLLEKTPGHLMYADKILRYFPEARVVEVLRDGRDVCVSMQMQAMTLDWPPQSRREQIQAWVRAVRRGIDLRADPEISPRIHLVRYEDVKRDAATEIERLLGFIGVDAEPSLIADIADRSDFRHQRITGDGQHRRRGEIGDWENHFTADDEELFRSLAGELFEEAGYRF